MDSTDGYRRNSSGAHGIHPRGIRERHRMNAAGIARGLRKWRKSGSGWMACCPVHEDRTPSLSLNDTADGKVLVHCQAGCGQHDVIAALKDAGLWPKPQREPEPGYATSSKARWETRQAAAYYDYV